jgi:hypothetical protein
MKKWLFLLAGFWFLTGCAPQYETRYALTPPTSTGGLACLQGCEAKSRSCNLQCSQQYGQCSTRAEQQASNELPERVKEYDSKLAAWQQEMNRYETELRFYEMELHQREMQEDLRRLTCERDGKESASCRDHHARLHALSPLSTPDRPGSAPEKPTLANESARIRDLTCSNECQCDDQYRLCYSSCGGTVKPYQFCVQNCPAR